MMSGSGTNMYIHGNPSPSYDKIVSHHVECILCCTVGDSPSRAPSVRLGTRRSDASTLEIWAELGQLRLERGYCFRRS